MGRGRSTKIRFISHHLINDICRKFREERHFCRSLFWIKKLITPLKYTGKILFITFILPHSTCWIPSLLFYRIYVTPRELKRIEKGIVTTKLLFLLDYLAQIHILLRFRDKKRKLEA